MLLRKLATVAMIIFAGAVFSQAPEFTQQYYQRIGGALDELRTIVTNFEWQASQNRLDRKSALNLYAASPEPFLRSQGESMRETIDRFDRLSAQRAELTREPLITRPILLLRRFDLALAGNAWADFAPAFPLSMAGAVWALAGALVGWALTLAIGAVCSRRSKQNLPPFQSS